MKIEDSQNGRKEIDLVTRVLTKQFEEDIEKYLRNEIMQKLDENIKKIAKEAVKKWTLNVSMTKEMGVFNNIDKVIIEFVEKIINVAEYKKEIEIEERK